MVFAAPRSTPTSDQPSGARRKKNVEGVIHPGCCGCVASVLDAAIRIHRALGPGLLESAYLACLEYELTEAQIRIERHRAVPLVYKGVRIDCGFRADIVVEGSVLIEIKAQEVIAPIHTRQLQTYLRLGQYPVGLLLNFDAPTMKAGMRIVNNSPIRSARRGRRAQGKAKRRERRGAEIR